MEIKPVAMEIDMDIISEKSESVAMDIDMEPEPARGSKKSSHNSKRVVAPKRYEENMDKRNNSRCRRGQIQKKDKACRYWLAGNCKYASDDCKYLHSHVIEGSNVTFMTKLIGHDNKPIRGVAFLSHSGSAKLHSAGQDNKLIAWDCHTGQGTNIPLGGDSEVGCLLGEGPWLFVGLRNAVKALNTANLTELLLDGPKGQVHALAIANQMIFAGTHDGTILAWKFNPAANTFDPVTSLTGHMLPVVSLVSVKDKLYSASMDHTIRVWDLETFRCIQTLGDHTSVVTSLLCWEQFLLSCSLDGTVKVWDTTSSVALEEIYTHIEKHGVLALCIMKDEQANPILLCSGNDNTVRIYDLPSFHERGRAFSRNEVRAFEIGPDGIFFTGDGMGELKVWKLATQTP